MTVMLTLLDILIILVSLAEVILLAVLERRMWGTIYTPLNFLMLPYAFVTACSVAMVHIFHLYPFNYLTLVVWDVGLLFFFIPSAVIHLLNCHRPERVTPPPHEGSISMPYKWVLIGFLVVTMLPYIVHLRSVAATSVAVVGTDEFSQETTTTGLWAHFFTMFLAVEVVCFRYLSKRNLWLLAPILIIIVFAVINQVKTHILVPLFTAVVIHLILGNIKFRLRTMITYALVGFGFFFFSYYLSLVFTQDKELEGYLIEFILKNFGHYFSSGVLGLSADIDHGIAEQPDWQYLFVPFVNFYRSAAGEEIYLPTISQFYLTTWYELGTNVRTLIGTAYIFGGFTVGSATIMLISAIAYIFRIKFLSTHSTLWLLCDAWWCALLLKGWFDYPYVLLRTFETMAFFVIAALFFHFLTHEQKKKCDHL